MYPSYQPYRPRRSRGSYLFPFLTIIVIGLTLVFAFNIYSYFREQREKAPENKGAVKLVSGQAEVLLFGETEWLRAREEGHMLLTGDSFRTLPSSRATISFLNGGVIRLDSSTEITLSEVKTKNGEDSLHILLKKGHLWLKKTQKEGVFSNFSVDTGNIVARSTGTAFAVSKDTKETVRVLEGKVDLDLHVFEGGKRTRVDTVTIGVGQEISLSSKNLESLQARKPLELLSAISDQFRGSEWFAWNRKEDENPTFTLSVKEVAKQDTPVIVPNVSSQKPIEPAEKKEDTIAPPTILTPIGTERTTKQERIVISGKTSQKTKRIIVTSYVGGTPESYPLQRYVAGSTEWNYVAGVSLGNFVPGKNRYTIVAEGSDGRKSEPAEITITLEKTREPADLSMPKVTLYNGGTTPEVTEDSVKIDGTIGKGIVKVYVNGFPLTRYVPNGASWSFYAKAEYNNLQEGENVYEVYGIDADGNKTETLKFTLKKLPKSVSEPPSEGTTTYY